MWGGDQDNIVHFMIYLEPLFWRVHMMRDEEQRKEEYGILVDYKSKIIRMLEEIENPVVLMKIYTVVRTHLKILREKGQED